MGFFNKKEQVLDIQLTSYGKTLLSQGRMDPVYYSFFDEEILYDTDASGAPEDQNYADRRIKYETPALKVRAEATSAEDRVTEHTERITTFHDDHPTVADNSVQHLGVYQNAPNPYGAQSSGMCITPLGTSDLKTEFAPAWKLNLLNGTITESSPYLTVNLTASNVDLKDGYVQNIPQLDIELDYKTFFSTEDERAFEDIQYNRLSAPLNIDGISLYVEENYLLIDVQELNSIFAKENFEVEVFLSQSVPAGPNLYTGTGRTNRYLPIPLFFSSQDELLSPMGTKIVERHLNIAVDKEIPLQIQETHNIKDYISSGGKARLSLGRDLYGDTPNEEPCE